MNPATGTEPGRSRDTAISYATIHLRTDAAPTSRSLIDRPSAGAASPRLRSQVTAIVDPACQTTSDPGQPNVVGLHLHHPELGWLSFALTRTAVRTLGDVLAAHAAHMEPEQGGQNAG